MLNIMYNKNFIRVGHGGTACYHDFVLSINVIFTSYILHSCKKIYLLSFNFLSFSQVQSSTTRCVLYLKHPPIQFSCCHMDMRYFSNSIHSCKFINEEVSSFLQGIKMEMGIRKIWIVMNHYWLA